MDTRSQPEHTPRVNIDVWWPRLRDDTREWLVANNGDAVPTSVMADIEAAGGPAPSDPWWSDDPEADGRRMPDEAVDWIEEAANAEPPED